MGLGVREGGRITSLSQFFVFSNALDYLINIVSWWFVVCYLGNVGDLWHHKARIIWISVFWLEVVNQRGKSFLVFLIDNLTFDVVQFIKYVRQAYEMSVSKKRLHTNGQCFILLLETNNASLWCYKRITLSFGVTNEQRFPLVLQTNNAFLWCYKRTTLLEPLLKHISVPTIRSISVFSKSSWYC